MNTHQIVKISEFISISVQLAFQAAKLINSHYFSPNFQKFWKGQDDPVTLADIQAQTLIVNGLRHFWPDQ